MREIFPFVLIAILLIGCNSNKTEPTTPSDAKKPSLNKDTIPKVTGIGGVFFKSKNPQEVKDWYGNNLGIAIGPYGSPFEFRNAHRPEEINYLNWDPFPDTTSYFDPSEKEFMINYRVQNIEGLV